MFSRITSFRFSGIKGNTGKGFGAQGRSPQKVKSTGSPLQQSRVQKCVQSLSSPDWRKICTSMRTSDQKTPRNPSRWELRGRLLISWGGDGPHRSHNTVEGARLQSTGCGWGGRRSLGQGGPIDTRVVEGTVVLIAAVALHHEMSADRAF